jgi:DNA-binding FadR family transcriptional regulator
MITEADLAFHEVIIVNSENRFFHGIMRFLHEPLSRARRLTMDAGGAEGRRRAFEHHVDIHDAILRHDPQASRTAMKAHMQQLEEDIRSAFHSLDVD